MAKPPGGARQLGRRRNQRHLISQLAISSWTARRGQLEHEVGREADEIPAHLFVEASRGHSVEVRQVLVEVDPLATHLEDEFVM